MSGAEAPILAAGDGPVILHASCVALPGPSGAPLAALILGPSGAGKSTLALDILSRGGILVSDDRTRVRRDGGRLLAACPSPAHRGLIEARGVGLLRVPALEEAEAVLVVDLSAAEGDRLPPPRRALLLGRALPRILGAAGDRAGTAPFGPPALAAAVALLLRGGGAPEPV
ncbi:HPr kinase/phosphorylase [Rhodovulum sp. DZ06]|uniref:HPr kinase/phosphorylase n=1 Tax=Rhodovulum sp. DZ06 TaxID=3425126 RepID=UPI003D33D9A0